MRYGQKMLREGCRCGGGELCDPWCCGGGVGGVAARVGPCRRVCGVALFSRRTPLATVRTRWDVGGGGRVQMSEFSWTSGWPLQIINSRRRGNTKTDARRGWSYRYTLPPSRVYHIPLPPSPPTPGPRTVVSSRSVSPLLPLFQLPSRAAPATLSTGPRRIPRTASLPRLR